MMKKSDTWASGAAYEPYVGRWSRHISGTMRDRCSWCAYSGMQRGSWIGP